MKTRRLSRGRIEAYNSQVRIRLEPLSGRDISRVTIFRLKPNGFYASRRYLEVQNPISIQEVVGLCGDVGEIVMAASM